MKKSACFIVMLFALTGTNSLQTLVAGDVVHPGTPWPAVDRLGRVLPLPQQVEPPKTGRFIGIFYFLWHHDVPRRSPSEPGPYDIARIRAQDPDAVKKPDSALWGGIGNFVWPLSPTLSRRHASNSQP